MLPAFPFCFILEALCGVTSVVFAFFLSLQLGQCQDPDSKEASITQTTLTWYPTPMHPLPTGQELHLSSAWRVHFPAAPHWPLDWTLKLVCYLPSFRLLMDPVHKGSACRVQMPWNGAVLVRTQPVLGLPLNSWVIPSAWSSSVLAALWQ